MYDNGIMAADTWIDNYYVNASGAWVPSYEPPHWILSSAGWWYRNADGSYPAGAWQLIDNQWYYFNSAGYMVTGWYLDQDGWYYFNGSGAMMTGWQLVGGSWYYLDGANAEHPGLMVSNCGKEIDGQKYFFNRSGASVHRLGADAGRVVLHQWKWSDGDRLAVGGRCVVLSGRGQYRISGLDV